MSIMDLESTHFDLIFYDLNVMYKLHQPEHIYFQVNVI